jgi:hypothetical protein
MLFVHGMERVHDRHAEMPRRFLAAPSECELGVGMHDVYVSRSLGLLDGPLRSEGVVDIGPSPQRCTDGLEAEHVPVAFDVAGMGRGDHRHAVASPAETFLDLADVSHLSADDGEEGVSEESHVHTMCTPRGNEPHLHYIHPRRLPQAGQEVRSPRAAMIPPARAIACLKLGVKGTLR